MEEGHNELSVLYSVYSWLLQILFTLSMHATLFPFHPHSSLIIIYAVYLYLSCHSRPYSILIQPIVSV